MSGGASQLVVQANDALEKLVQGSAQMPEVQQKLSAVLQQFQAVVDELGAAPGGEPQAPQGAVTSPEAGAAKVRPAM